MSRHPISLAGLFALAALAGPTAPAGAEVPVGPPTFSDSLNITNRYAPFQPGATKVYRGKGEEETIVVVDRYLDETRTFSWSGMDVDTWILEEAEFEDGRTVEISYNYFAQGDDGAVYYFGEVVDIYNGKGEVVDHEGSWLVGGPTEPGDPPETGDAEDPALFMPGNPEVGDRFKPEDLFPIVDETVKVIATDLKVRGPAGRFRKCIQVKETTQLSDEVEKKWYARDVGVILTKAEDEVLKLIASTLHQ